MEGTWWWPWATLYQTYSNPKGSQVPSMFLYSSFIHHIIQYLSQNILLLFNVLEICHALENGKVICRISPIFSCFSQERSQYFICWLQGQITYWPIGVFSFPSIWNLAKSLLGLWHQYSMCGMFWHIAAYSILWHQYLAKSFLGLWHQYSVCAGCKKSKDCRRH